MTGSHACAVTEKSHSFVMVKLLQNLYIHANVFNHYHRIKKALTTYKAFGCLGSLLQCDVISGWC